MQIHHYYYTTSYHYYQTMAMSMAMSIQQCISGQRQAVSDRRLPLVGDAGERERVEVKLSMPVLCILCIYNYNSTSENISRLLMLSMDLCIPLQLGQSPFVCFLCLFSNLNSSLICRLTGPEISYMNTA